MSSQPILRTGSKGAFVRVLQETLNNFGYALTVDGDFGTKTRQAVEAFQARVGILQDGIVGADTYSNKNDEFFKLKDAIDLMQGLYQKQALFFSSPKSESDSLMEVWKPDSLYKIQFTSGVGDGNKATDYLFFLNCPNQFFTEGMI